MLLAVLYDFNPRSPHGERRQAGNRGQLHKDFNPRSPHGERPDVKLLCNFPRILFQPTLPARGATRRQPQANRHVIEFQPTLPARGATAPTKKLDAASTTFQPTLPARGATGRVPMAS